MPRNENQGLGARVRVTTYDADLSEAADQFLNDVHAQPLSSGITCNEPVKPRDRPLLAPDFLDKFYKQGCEGMVELEEIGKQFVKESINEAFEKDQPESTFKFAKKDGELIIEETTGPYRTFESGSIRDNDDDKPLPMELNPYMLIRYGYHMKYGQMRYGDSNWELGQTDVEIWRSMSRHFMQAYMNFKFPNVSKATDDGTDHLSALLFGINMLMHNECNNGVEADKYFKSRK